jgi:hypothetical protein
MAQVTIWSHFVDRSWTGTPRVQPLDLDAIFREFNRVDEMDVEHLEQIGYHLPSLSVGDTVTVHYPVPTTWLCKDVGWIKVS